MRVMVFLDYCQPFSQQHYSIHYLQILQTVDRLAMSATVYAENAYNHILHSKTTHSFLIALLSKRIRLILYLQGAYTCRIRITVKFSTSLMEAILMFFTSFVFMTIIC